MCVACGAGGGTPLKELELFRNPIGRPDVLTVMEDPAAMVAVPVCARCERWVRKDRDLWSYGQLAAILAAIVGCLWVAIILDVRPGVVHWMVVLATAFVALAFYLVKGIFTPPFDFETIADHTEFDFSNESVANEFATLNGVPTGTP